MDFNYNYLDVRLLREDIIQVYLNRPDLHNAFNEELITELSDFGKRVQKNSEIRIVILSGRGKSFCAGADLNWMKKTKMYSYEQNVEDAKKLGKMFHILDRLPQVVIGRINGSTIGGGTGLVSACDVSVTIEKAKFGFSEVNLVLSPAVISPFVLRKIGFQKAREFFLTGERFSGEIAKDMGLINYVVANEQELDKKIEDLIQQVYSSGPKAVVESKRLLRLLENKNMDDLLNKTAELIATLRISPEGQEGISAFLEKRKPNWFKSLETKDFFNR